MEQKSENLSIGEPGRLAFSNREFDFQTVLKRSNLCVPFPSNEEATIAYGSLSVDKEPKRGGCTKTMSVQDNQLHVHFEAKEARLLRVSVNSFFDYLNLVVQTMDQFGPPVPADTDKE